MSLVVFSYYSRSDLFLRDIYPISEYAVQYLGSLSVIRVNWVGMGSRFENAFCTTDANGHKHAPSVSSTWSRLVDFLTADFQKRASFVAGLALGLRLG